MGYHRRREPSSRSVHIDPALRGLAKKLREKRVKINVVVARLAAMDRNQDGLIHISDLEEVLIEYLGVDGISRREVEHLGRLLSNENFKGRGIIEYRKIVDILKIEDNEYEITANINMEDTKGEIWYDPTDLGGRRVNFDRGSVGDWLQNAACPAEVKNFRRFIQCLEEYERLSGLKCVPIENGFTVPFGPDLKAGISFYMNK